MPTPSGTEPRQYQGDLQLNSSIDNNLIHDDVDEQRSSNDDDSPSSPDYSPPEESDNSSLGSNDPGYDNEANADALLLLDQVKQHIREVTQYAENSNSFADISELTTQCTEMLSRIHEIKGVVNTSWLPLNATALGTELYRDRSGRSRPT